MSNEDSTSKFFAEDIQSLPFIMSGQEIAMAPLLALTIGDAVIDWSRQYLPYPTEGGPNPTGDLTDYGNLITKLAHRIIDGEGEQQMSIYTIAYAIESGIMIGLALENREHLDYFLTEKIGDQILSDLNNPLYEHDNHNDDDDPSDDGRPRTS